MIKKVLILAAGGAGYVLGARAGRGRYEQIRTQAEKVWSNPQVQQVASDAQDLAAEKAPVVKETVKDAASSAAKKASTTAKDAAGAASDKVSDQTKDTPSDVEGIDLVAAASSVPEDPKP